VVEAGEGEERVVLVLAEEEDLVLRARNVGRCVVAVAAVWIVGEWSLEWAGGGDCASIIGFIMVLIGSCRDD